MFVNFCLENKISKTNPIQTQNLILLFYKNIRKGTCICQFIVNEIIFLHVYLFDSVYISCIVTHRHYHFKFVKSKYSKLNRFVFLVCEMNKLSAKY